MIARDSRAVWIAWERHRRTRGLVAALGIRLEEYHSRLPRALKHPLFAARTVGCLLRRRPHVLFVQSPSLILNLLVAVLKPVLRYRLVVDAHNAGVYSCDARTDRIAWLYPWLHRRADVTVVTNRALSAIVTANGGRPAILVDPLPDLAPTPAAVPGETPLIAFICTFATDEPFNEVIRAADRLGGEARVLVTGNVENNRHLIEAEIGPRVEFTGFLPEEEFVDLLARSHLIVDLTTFDDCLVCGGYEAAAVGTPIVLSDTPANRETFSAGAVYCANDAPAIAEAIRDGLARQGELRREMQGLRARLRALFEEQLDELVKALN